MRPRVAREKPPLRRRPEQLAAVDEEAPPSPSSARVRKKKGKGICCVVCGIRGRPMGLEKVWASLYFLVLGLFYLMRWASYVSN